MMLYGVKMSEIRKVKTLCGTVVPCSHFLDIFIDIVIPDFCEK